MVHRTVTQHWASWADDLHNMGDTGCAGKLQCGMANGTKYQMSREAAADKGRGSSMHIPLVLVFVVLTKRSLLIAHAYTHYSQKFSSSFGEVCGRWRAQKFFET